VKTAIVMNSFSVEPARHDRGGEIPHTPPTTPIDLPLVQPVYLRLLLAGAKAEGIDLTNRLAALGMDGATLREHDDLVPLATWRQLLRDLQRQGRGTNVAIRVGYRVPLSAHGPLAYLMACARDLRQALKALARFAPLRLSVLDLRLREHAHGVELRAEPRVSLGDVERSTLDFLWAMVCRMLDELCRGAAGAMTLRVPAPRSGSTPVWAELGVGVGTSTSGMFLQLPRGLVDAALPTVSASEYQRAWRACEAAELEQGWTKSMAAQIEQLFRTGLADSYKLAWVAQRLGVSTRTVIRRLSTEGTQFSLLVEASRQQRLLRRLSERQLTLGDIAVDLGYADGSAFNRAVRRRFGIGPRALQRAVLEGRVPINPGGRGIDASPKIKLTSPND
jgi:AraC-like DNA-binding protein